MYWLPSYRLTPVSGDKDEDEDDWSGGSFVSSLNDLYRKLVSDYLKEGEEEEEEEEEVEEEEDDVDEGEDSDGSDVVEVYSPTLGKRKDKQGDGNALLTLAKHAADSAADGQKNKKKRKTNPAGVGSRVAAEVASQTAAAEVARQVAAAEVTRQAAAAEVARQAAAAEAAANISAAESAIVAAEAVAKAKRKKRRKEERRYSHHPAPYAYTAGAQFHNPHLYPSAGSSAPLPPPAQFPYHAAFTPPFNYAYHHPISQQPYPYHVAAGNRDNFDIATEVLDEVESSYQEIIRVKDAELARLQLDVQRAKLSSGRRKLRSFRFEFLRSCPVFLIPI